MATIAFDLALAAQPIDGGGYVGLRGNLTMSGDNYLVSNQNVTTGAAQLLSCGSVTGLGTLMIVSNLDTANNVTLYADSGSVYVASILHPGQFAIFFSHQTPAIYAAATTATCVVEKGFFESVGISSGAIIDYRPALPALGYAVASFSLDATIGSARITMARSYTQTADVVGCGSLAVDVSGNSLAWPAAWALSGGSQVGYIALVNHDTSDMGQLRVGVNLADFALVPPVKGFALLPVNAANGPYLDGTAHVERVLITRRTP